MKTKFKVGDKVIVNKKNSFCNQFNGMVGKIDDITINLSSRPVYIINSISNISGFCADELELFNSKPTKYIIAFDVQEFPNLYTFRKFLNENKETNGRLFRISKSYKLKVTTKTRLVKE